jgi:peroxiredoxin
MSNLFKILIFFALTALPLVTSANEKTLSDFNGKPATISQFAGQGKWLVVMLWASDCMVCNQEAHEYVKFHNLHKDKDAQVLGISLDGNEKLSDAQAFVKRHKISFPNLIGEAINIASMYQESTGGNWIGTPSFMVFNPKGELLGAQAGAVPVSIIESFIEREATAATQSGS